MAGPPYEQWEKASLFPAGTSPARSPTKRAAEEAPAWWSEVGGSLVGGFADEAESPFEGWEVQQFERRTFRQLGPAVRHAGALLKAYGEGPNRVWRSRWVFLTADRLCYTPDPDAESVRYLPLDRIPVRALPRGYGPKLGVTVVEDRQVDRSHPQFSPKKAGCVFSVACGSHTHFFAAPSPAEARAWVETITAAWVQCVKHTARGMHSPTAEETLVLKEARWRAQSESLRRSVAEAEQQRLRDSTAAWQAAAAAATAVDSEEQQVCYDIEVVTGVRPDAGTTSRVYLELCGEGGSSGEHRLMYREGSVRVAFCAGATDTFKLHCQSLGELLKVRMYHSNAGPHPAWFLEEVRVRRQDAPQWTVFPCRRWLAVHQDDGRVMRELHCASTQTVQAIAPPVVAPPPVPQPPPTAAPVPEEQKPPVATERVVQPKWYTVVVCTKDEEGAGLAAAEEADSTAPPAVFVVLQGSRGSSQRVKLPSQAGDFERGQEDVFRMQLPCVGTLEKLTVGLSTSKEAAWLLDQVEVTDETTGETVFFPCSAWLGPPKGPAERRLLGSRTNPREAQREVARLREQAQAASRQLAEAQAELSAARAAASGVEHAGRGQQAQLEAQLVALQGEVGQLKKVLSEAQSGSAQAEAQVQQLRSQLARAEERAAILQREQEAGRLQEGSDAARAAQLAAQVQALQDNLAEAQEAAAAAATRARKCEAEAQRAEEALDDLRSQHERHKRDSSASVADIDAELRRLRAEVAAKAAELREAKQAESEYAAECDQLTRDLAEERLKSKERLEEAEKKAAAASAEAAAAAAAAAAATEAASSQPPTPASAKRQATYRVSVHTSAEPSHVAHNRPVWLELVGSHGSTGPIALDRQGSATCFSAGACDVLRLEAPAVGDLQQLNIWVEAEGTAVPAGDAGTLKADAGSDSVKWHLDYVEVAPQGPGTPRPSFFTCRKWLDARNGHRAELPASAINPREEVEYKVVVYTSGIAGCGTSGNVFLDLKGDKASSGVLTLRNKGGSFRPAQTDTFTFRLPAMGALQELRVGHDGRREWHLERVEVKDTTSGTTFFFPCGRWVPPGAMSRALQLRGYTTDPGSLPVRYRVELEVEGMDGTPPRPDGLRLTLFGARGDSGVQHVDASRASAGRSLTGWFEAENVGTMSRLRIGLAPAPAGQHSALLVASVAVTNMLSGESASFHCAEWLRSADPYDLELDAAEAGQDQEEVPCVYRLEVQTSDVRKAGTAGSVFLTIIGEACTIGPYQLSNTEAEHFQRGQLDVFEIDGAPDCGRLRQIEVRHDGKGRSSGWHLSWVKVSNMTTSAVAMFKCNRWVDKRSHADPGIVAVVVALPPDQAAAAAGRQRSAKDRVLLGKWGSSNMTGPGHPTAVAAAAAAQVPLQQDQRMEAELGGVIETTVPAGGPPAGPPGYRVAFHTSRICGSGTRAKVRFELTGSGGSSGVLHPVGTSRSFGAGRLDIFDYPALPFLGELQSARVGTDGSGFFPAWHLAMVVITHLPTGRMWQFSCYNWIDKKCNYSRLLQLDSISYSSNKQQAAVAAASVAAGSPKGSWGQPTRVFGPGATASSSSPTHLQGTQYGSSRSASPSRFAAAQQQHPHQQHSGSAAGSPLRAKAPVTGRSGSPVRAQGWHQLQQQQQYGGPYNGMPGSPLIAAGRPYPSGGTRL